MSDHGGHTFVTLVEAPSYQARCNLCGWRGPLRNREQHSLAVEDSQEHAFGIEVDLRAELEELGLDPRLAPAALRAAEAFGWSPVEAARILQRIAY